MKRWLMLMILALLTAACQPGGGDSGGGAGSPADTLVNWVRDPYHVVFRAEVVGGKSNEDEFVRLSDVPACTIYGDGRVVWTVDQGGGGVPKVLFDFLSDDQITEFALFLTIEGRFLTYPEEYPNQIPTAETPVYEKMTLAINDVTHVTDAFAEWPVTYYSSILTYCQTIGKTPRSFEPDGAWISVRETTYNPSLPSIVWDPDAAGLSLTELLGATEKRWIEGQNVRILWRALRDNSALTQFSERDLDYQVLLQVPGVTLDAPPAPAQ